MSPPSPGAAALRRNRLLAMLDEGTLAALAPELQMVPLAVPELLLKEGGPVRNVWFPVRGVVSMLAAVAGAQSRIEVGTVGMEGMVGLPLFLGPDIAPGDCFTQVEGEAWRLSAAFFATALEAFPDLPRVLHRYTQALFVQISQSTACNRVHSAAQRCARWLLTTADRVQDDAFLLTQEFLAQMLGERRPTVSRVASDFQARGLVSYSRGHMVLLDRRRLEEEACPCYGVVRDAYERMLVPRHRS